MRNFHPDAYKAPSRIQQRLTSRVIAGLFILGAPLSWSNAYAGSYEALCAGSACNVEVTPDNIRSPFGEIPSSRVTYWSSSGESKTSIGTGVATTILFGGIGLLGFLAKNHDYTFTISGFDAEGKKVSMLIQFKNDKPAKRLSQELFSVTGLGMNQQRTIDEIAKSESAVAGSELGTLGLSTAHGKEPQLSALASGKPQPASRNCWSTYIASNPAMKQWSDSNPSMAEQNKKRFEAC